ncbi:hypothetical protein [Acidiplasma sp. MBA-1]|nr:hypothetical protein [Acidiplasma sp. MBA-1]KJE49303.1 hypothetical protein TZ01_04420 [Acidiplasma sp. MBA-1]
MGVYLEIIFTVLGGLIAGVVGLSSTYVSLRAHRREMHFEEHKENLRLLESALRQGKRSLWPFTNGAEDIELPHKYEITPALDTGINFILNILVTKYSDNNMYSVDSVLYKDIKNHFHNLWKMLTKTDKDIKENARTTFEKLNEISSSIYKSLNKNNPEVTFRVQNMAPNQIGGEKPKIMFNDTDEDGQCSVAGDVFLFAVKEDESDWPNKIGILKKIGLYNTLKNIGDAVNNEMKDEINEMLGIREKLFSDIDDCINEIENILHQTKLMGRCKLA